MNKSTNVPVYDSQGNLNLINHIPPVSISPDFLNQLGFQTFTPMSNSILDPILQSLNQIQYPMITNQLGMQLFSPISPIPSNVNPVNLQILSPIAVPILDPILNSIANLQFPLLTLNNNTPLNKIMKNAMEVANPFNKKCSCSKCNRMTTESHGYCCLLCKVTNGGTHTPECNEKYKK